MKIKKMLKKIKCHFHYTCNYRGVPQLNCSLRYRENNDVHIIEHYSSEYNKSLITLKITEKF